MVNPTRIFHLNNKPYSQGPVLYWMQRDQRVKNNWALLYTQQLALEMKQPLVVVFCLVSDFLEAGSSIFTFMMEGVAEIGRVLPTLNIPFILLKGDPLNQLPLFTNNFAPSCIVTDFNPLLLTRHWKWGVAEKVNIPVIEVDSHNIIPYRLTSIKQEFSARTIRGKIEKLLPEYLEPIPKLIRHPFSIAQENLEKSGGFRISEEMDKIGKTFKYRTNGGENSAEAKLEEFICHRLDGYDSQRNFPEKVGQSGLSPYLHFGQISAQHVALEVSSTEAPAASKKAFLEELIVRRELSDNFCFYNEKYDIFEGFPPWAKATLNKHRDDPREYLYSPEQLEHALTHDDLWNAAQKEMVILGKMHGYLRMYWAKKILEWTSSPEEALAVAIYLNDKYSLDGRDPNGYSGIAWSIGGVHDRPWGERKIFGMIRYMNYNGCLRKFNVKEYIRIVNNL